MLRISIAALAVAACAQTTPAGPIKPQPEPQPEPAPEPDKEPDQPTGNCTDSESAMQDERFGELRLGLAAAEIKTLLGEPDEISDPEENAAAGTWQWSWTYRAKKMRVQLAATTKTDPQTVEAISLDQGSTLTTRFGIGIGSTVADIERAYGSCVEEDPETPGTIETGTVVVGSVYGGVMFTVEDSVVTSIFVGAAAE